MMHEDPHAVSVHMCVSDQEGGRWRSVSPEEGLEGGAAVWAEGGDGGNGGEFRSVPGCKGRNSGPTEIQLDEGGYKNIAAMWSNAD